MLDPARTPTSDEALIASFVERGDEGAIRTLVERHQQRIFGFLFGMVRDRETANDLFQETFFRILSALRSERASYTHQGRFLGWAMRIARNAALDHLRSRSRWVDVDQSAAEDGNSYWDRLTDDAPSAEQNMHRKDQREWLLESIDRLPPEQREVVLLRHESELTFREIAEMTGVSINTALGRMRYALINLRRMIPADELRTADS